VSEIRAEIMWDEPTPKWRTARKQYQCKGEGCAKVIASGEQYLDKALIQPAHSHFRYCKQCAEFVVAEAAGYHFFSRNDIFLIAMQSAFQAQNGRA
jgi:hypothetical protein